jgi:hypothetical protein
MCRTANNIKKQNLEGNAMKIFSTCDTSGITVWVWKLGRQQQGCVSEHTVHARIYKAYWGTQNTNFGQNLNIRRSSCSSESEKHFSGPSLSDADFLGARQPVRPLHLTGLGRSTGATPDELGHPRGKATSAWAHPQAVHTNPAQSRFFLTLGLCKPGLSQSRLLPG